MDKHFLKVIAKSVMAKASAWSLVPSPIISHFSIFSKLLNLYNLLLPHYKQINLKTHTHK